MPAAKKIANPVRRDPKTRPVNAGSPYFDLVNPDPGFEYRWVYKAAAEHGVEYYESMGYEPVQYVAGGAKPKVGKVPQPGALVESRGHVLMHCTRERADEITQFGEDGSSGQALADTLEKRMRNGKKAVADISNGVALQSREGNQYFELESEKGSIAIADKDD